ncbi:MAG: hypothetical protein CXT65_06650 [Methanobacteriota archaeon]|nr:MAG: hypothetical protein CXT65_06650 [Euryarchaeota archaeon]
MPEEDAELGDDFAYILRMADSDVDGLRPIAIGLTSIKGVGMRTSQAVISPRKSRTVCEAP